MRVETGSGAAAFSIVEAEYGPCACSAVGKEKKVSRPFGRDAQGNDEAKYWMEHFYDELGRAVGGSQPNEAGSTVYVFLGTTVTVTDPAGKWKRRTTDGFGILVMVEEPNPAGGTWTTSYVYNQFNQFTQVSMPQPGRRKRRR